jgi:hypothetical protein
MEAAVAAQAIKIVVAALVAVASTAGALTAAELSTKGPIARSVPHSRVPLAPLIRKPRSAQPLTAQKAVEELSLRGFRDFSTPQRKGRVMVVDAVAPRGEKLTLVVDLSSGVISGARFRAE